jgi:thiamine transport system substrate-binding protein
VKNKVLVEYVSPNAEFGSADFSDQGKWLTAIDYGDVCFNADLAWFAKQNLALPISFADLAKPEYRDLTVVSNPASSSPGLAFLAATVSAFGDEGYADYWKSLVDNGVLVVAGWEDAYFTEFSGSSGAGSRPIVLSYSSSPAAEIREDGKSGTTTLLDTCTRQTEYAGVISGTDNEVGAQKFIDFLLSPEVQATLPTAMYVYPVSGNVTLPEAWKQFAPVASTAKVHNLPSERFEADRETWQKTIAALIGQ